MDNVLYYILSVVLSYKPYNYRLIINWTNIEHVYRATRIQGFRREIKLNVYKSLYTQQRWV